jgi:hypothetical protein
MPEGKRLQDDLDLEGRIILKRILEEKDELA